MNTKRLLKWKNFIVFLLVVALTMQDIRPLAATKEKDDMLVIPTVTTSIHVKHGEGTGVTQINETQYIIANHQEMTATVSMQVQNLQGQDYLEGVYSGVELGYIQDDETGGGVLGPTDTGHGGISARVVENNNIWKDSYLEGNSSELTDPNHWYDDTLILDYKAEHFTSDTSAKIYSYDIKVKFNSGTRENAVVDLKSFAGFRYFVLANGMKFDNKGEGFTSSETTKSKVQLVNSNLEWKANVTPFTGAKRDDSAPALWKKYNYQDLIATMENTSASEDAYMDEFEFVFKFPYDNGLNGVVNKDMIAWLYDENNPEQPIENEAKEPSKEIKYTGKWNQGGVLIYDVTDLTDEQIRNYESLGTPLPYVYTGQGICSVILDKNHGGLLVSPDRATQENALKQEEGKEQQKLYSSRKLLVRVPMPNNFFFPNGQDYVPVSTRSIPTVRFGDPAVSLSNQGQSIIQYFKKPRTGGTLKKTAMSSKAYIGKEVGYTISDAFNKGNFPAFHPRVEDTLPAYFDLTRLEYYLSEDEVKKMKDREFSSIMNVDNPIELAFKNKKQEITWVKLNQTWKEKNTENGKLWEIDGLDGFLGEYLKNNKEETFTRKIRFNYGYQFDDLETTALPRDKKILGELRVYGIPKKAVTFENKAELWLDYWRWDELNQTTYGWNHKYIGPYQTSASAMGVEPALWSMTQALYDDTRDRRESSLMIGVANTNVNGYTVRFGDGNESILYGGKVEMQLPYSTTHPNDYIGFDTEEIVITKELLDKAPVKTIVVDWYNGSTSTYSLTSASWEKDEKGNYLLKKEKFPYSIKIEEKNGKKIETKIPYIATKVTLYLEHLKANTQKPTDVKEDKAYVQFLGSYPYPGDLTLKTVLSSNYQDGVQRELSSSSQATLRFLEPELLPVVHGVFQNGKAEEYKEDKSVTGVLNKPYGGYRFYAQVGTTALEPGAMTLQLPYQFFSHNIRISSDLIGNITDKEGKISWRELQITGSKGSVVTYSKEELEKLKKEDGVFLLEKDWKEKFERDSEETEGKKGTWQEGEYVKEIKLTFKTLKVTEEKAGYIGVDGTATITRRNIAIGTLSTDYPKSVNKGIEKKAQGEIVIDDPDLQILVQAFAEEDQKRVEAKEVNGIKLEEQVGYTYRIGSANSSRIEPGVLSIKLPMWSEEEEARILSQNNQKFPENIEQILLKDPKFLASEIIIKKEMLDEMKLTGLKIVSANGEETMLSAKDLGITWKPDENSEYMTFKDDITITKDKWTGVARFVYVYFDYYKENKTISVPSSKQTKQPMAEGKVEGEGADSTKEDGTIELPQEEPKPDMAYIQIRGAGQREDTYKSTGTVSTTYLMMPGYNVSKSDSAKIKFPNPDLTAKATAIFDNGVEKRLEQDSVKGTLNKPYAGYRFYAKTDVVALVPGEMVFSFPKDFKARQLGISKDLIEHLKDKDGKKTYTECAIVGTRGTKFILTAEQLQQLDKGEGIVIPNTMWEDKNWKEGERVSSMTLSFRILNRTEKDYAGYLEALGTVTFVGTHSATGTIRFPISSKYPNISKSDSASIVIPNANPWVYVNAFREKTKETRDEQKTVKAGKNEDCIGYTYRFGTEGATRLEPGKLTMMLPMTNKVDEDLFFYGKSEGEYPNDFDFTDAMLQQGAFVATEIVLNKEFLSEMKLTSVKIISNEKKETILTAKQLGIDWKPDKDSDFMTFDKDITIPSTKWNGIAYKVYVYFDYQKNKKEKPKTPEEALAYEAYAQVRGYARKEGTLVGRGIAATDYEESRAESNVSVKDKGYLNIESPSFTIEAKAHTEMTKENVVAEQHGKEIKIPIDWDTYYTYELKTKAEYSITSEAEITMELNNKIRRSDDAPHGFLPERFVIPANYESLFLKERVAGDSEDAKNGIIKIVVKDTAKPDQTQRECSFTMDDFEKDKDGNYYLTADKWKAKGVVYPSHFVLLLHGIAPTKEETSMLCTLYGKTDWYTYIDDYLQEDPKLAWNEKQEFNEKKWIKLDTTMKFKTFDMDTHDKKDKAYQDVPLPRVSLSVDFNNYYEHGQGVETTNEDSDRNQYVGGKMFSEYLWEINAYRSLDWARSYLAVPYEKTVTERFSLFQDSISKADEFSARLTLPIRSSKEEKEAKRGFHALNLLIEKQLFNGTHYQNAQFSLRDIEAMDEKEETDWEILLVPQEDKTTFTVERLTIKTNEKQPLGTIAVNSKGHLEITRKQWEEWGISSLVEVEVRGEDFITRTKNELGDIFVTGFSDSDFANVESISTKVLYGSAEGFHNITRTKADTILRDQKKKPRKEKLFARIRDEGRLFISKMFFDVQVETGYIRKEDTDKDPNRRYYQTGISKEHVRTGHNDAWVENTTNTSEPNWIWTYDSYMDQETLYMGYKGLVSIGVDLRQYLDDYTKAVTITDNYKPNGHATTYGKSTTEIFDIAKDYNENAYVKHYAYNTKAEVDIEVQLPVDKGYEAYYLKIDPRAVIGTHNQTYIDSITIVRNNGQKETLKGEQLVKNSAKWNEEKEKKEWYRINLLTQDSSKQFETDAAYKAVFGTNVYYRSPKEEMQQETAVKTVMFHLKINQKDSFDDIHAAAPDAGTWVQDTKDMVNQHMFEFVGRANQLGKMTATATATWTTGERTINEKGEKNPIRQTIIEKEKDGKTHKKTPWSLKNYYRYFTKIWYNYNDHLWHRDWMSKLFTAADLVSEAEIEVKLNGGFVQSQHIEDPDNATSRLDYIFGTEHPYDMRFYRTSSSSSPYVSYLDEVELENTLPPIKKMEDGQYWGFKLRKYLMKAELFDHIDAITFRDTDNQEVLRVTKASIEQYPKCDKSGKTDSTLEKNYYYISIYYADDTQKPAQTDNVIVLGEDQYLSKVSVFIYDLDGDGDYASDTHGRENNTFFDNKSTVDWLKAYGDVNVLNGQEKHNKQLDGINKFACIIRNKGMEEDKKSSIATMKAFMIPLELGSTVSLTDAGTKHWDYKVTKNDKKTNVAIEPMPIEWALNFENTGKKNNTTSNGESYEAANITKVAFKQPLPSELRLTKIKIPAVLFENNQSNGGISATSAFTVTDAKGHDEDVLSRFEKQGEFYVLDIRKLFEEGKLTREEKTYSDAIVPTKYLAERVTSFQAVLSLYKPLGAEQQLFDGNDILFEGIWIDQQKDSVEKKEKWDEYNTIPTGGRSFSWTYPERYYCFTTTIPKRENFVVDTGTFGSKQPDTNTKNTTSQVTVYNRVSEFSYEQMRGSDVKVRDKEGKWVDKVSLAYDVDRKKKGIANTPVSNNKLFSGDQIEYLLTFKEPASDKAIVREPIPIKNPTMQFDAPVGTRIVGWKFVDGTFDAEQVGEEQAITQADDLTVLAYDGVTDVATELQSEQEYRFVKDEKTNYKQLMIKTNGDHYVAPGHQYRVIVYVEMMTEDKMKTTVTETVSMSPEILHNYLYYVVNTKEGKCSDKNSVSGGGKAEYIKDLQLKGSDIKQRGIQITSTLTYGKDLGTPSLAIEYTNEEGEKLDQQEVKVTIGALSNTTNHFQDTMIYDLDFTKTLKNGKKQTYIRLNRRPDIQYEVSKPIIQEGANQVEGIITETDEEGVEHYYRRAKIYYKTKAEEIQWMPLEEKKFDDKEKELQFLQSIVQLRYVYEDVPAYVNDDGTTYPKMKPIELFATANYQEERMDIEYEKPNEYVVMPLKLEGIATHIHEEKPEDKTTIERNNATNERVYRRKPRVSMNIQGLVVETGNELEQLKTLDPMGTSSVAYRPEQEMIYRLTVRNEKGTVKVTTDSTKTKEEVYNTGTGELLEPVVYDKIPTQYMDIVSDFAIYKIDEQLQDGVWTEIKRQQLSQDDVKKIVSSEKLEAKDHYGSYYTDGKTYNPEDESKEKIEYTMYQFDFSKLGLNLERGQRLEIVYRVKLHEEHLPLKKDKETGRLPYTQSLSNRHHSPKLMSEDDLIHEIAVTGKRNPWLDPLEFLNNSKVYLSGQETIVAMTNGTTKKNNYQKPSDNTKYRSGGTTSELGFSIGNQDLYQSGRYLGDNFSSISYFDKVKDRITHTTSFSPLCDLAFSFAEKEDRNLIWSQHKMHLMKGWLGGASEIVGEDNDFYYDIDKNIAKYRFGSVGSSYIDYLYDEYPLLDGTTPAIEWKQHITSRVYAVNYGDYAIDGVQFTYVFPKGIKPEIKDGTLPLTVHQYNAKTKPAASTKHENKHSIEMVNVKEWKTVDNPKVSWRLLQAPSTDKKTTPSYTLVDERRNQAGEQRYAPEDIEGCYVLQITLEEPLQTYWGNTQGDYVLAVDIPSYVYGTTESGEWYDRLYVAPLDRKTNSYCQIYDTSYQSKKIYDEYKFYSRYYEGRDHYWWERTGKSEERYDLDMGGPEKIYTSDKYRPSGKNIPPAMYINGYNQQVNYVTAKEDPNILEDKNKILKNITNTREYVQAGTFAKTKKPFLRQWADPGEGDGSKTPVTNFIFEEEDTSQLLTLNMNVENRYYAAEYASDNGTSDRDFSYNLEDGGARGTFFDPVLTVVLPYGLKPVDEQKRPVSLTKQGETASIWWDMKVKQWDPSENSKGSSQQPKDLGEEQQKEQNLIKDAFDAKVEFDEATKQYIVRFIPKAITEKDVVALRNQQLLRVSFKAVSYDFQKHGPEEGKNKFHPDMIQTYVSSRMKAFYFTCDQKVKSSRGKNKYYVLSSNDDARQDSVGHKLIPYEDKEHNKKAYETGQLYYTEKEMAKQQPIPSLLRGEGDTLYADLNGNETPTISMKYAKDRTEEEDAMLVNTMRLFARYAQFTSEARISDKKDGEGILLTSNSTPNISTPFDYSDNPWYSIKLINDDIGTYDPRKTGAIRHATYVSQFYLPKELRYDDTLDDAADDKYADYYVEMIDNSGKKPVITKLDYYELQEKGWRVEVKSIGFDEEGRQMVRALVVPAENEQEGRAAGQLRYKEAIVLHIKARVAEMDPLDDTKIWKVPTQTEVFTKLYGLDGAYIDFRTLKPVKDQTLKYSRQLMELIVFKNRLSSDITGMIKNPLPDDENEELQPYLYDKTVGFSINQPRYDKVRTNTEKIRRVFPPEPITGEIPSRDALYKTSDAQNLLINAAGLANGAVQQFVLHYDIPYKSYLDMITDRNDKSGINIDIGIDAVTTGVWELPQNAKHREELEKNLRVYVYMRKGDAEGNYQYFDEAELDTPNSGWTLINPEGARIYDNQSVDLSKYDQKNTRQIVWVIRHKEDPIHYPVPKGMRLDIDADPVKAGKQSVFDVDPPTTYLGEGLHEKNFAQNVLDHAIHILVEATPIEQEERNQWVNYYVSPGSMYTDTKKVPVEWSNEYRAGYEIVPELPYIDIFLDTKYLKKVGQTGQEKYEWSPILLYDLIESKIVKHKVTLLDANNELMEKYGVDGEEDSMTRPEIMVALPLRESLPKDQMVYVPYQIVPKEKKEEVKTSKLRSLQTYALSGPSIRNVEETITSRETTNDDVPVQQEDTSIQGTLLDPNYVTNSYPIKAETALQWTAYIEDLDGNKYPLKDPNDSTPGYVQVSLRNDVENATTYIGDRMDRTVLTFRFDGKLRPGQKIVVEYLSKIDEGIRPPNAADFQIKAWATKYGAFLPSLLPKEAQDNTGDTTTVTPSTVGVRSDRFDLNTNTNINELLLEIVAQSGEIKGNRALIVQKYVSTKLNQTDKASTSPIPVQEGGIYTFTVGCQSPNVAEKADYVAPLIFDVLPYKGDQQIIGSRRSDGTLVAAPRHSMWSGWLIPESIKVWAVTRESANSLEMNEKVLASSKYDIFVGPIKKTQAGYELQVEADGKPILPSLEERSSSQFYADINISGENSAYIKDHFVKLSDLQNEKPGNYEELVKGIRMILVRFKNPKQTILYGQGSYKLEYQMRAPLNSQIFVGELKDPEEFKKYPSWNTATISALPYSDNIDLETSKLSYDIQESNRSGVYVQSLEKRGYLGDYVWNDYNVNGVQDEGYYDRLVDGKRHVFSGAAIDLNGDGIIDQEDDPGIDDVKVELLTKNGYPSNEDGQAVIKAPNNDFYYIINEQTGNYQYHADGVRTITNKGPVVTYTTKDYYGSKGYYIVSNLKPGEYRLRFTLPKEYQNFVTTTPVVMDKALDIYSKGDTLPILKLPNGVEQNAVAGNGTKVEAATFVTGEIEVEAVDISSEEAQIQYDQRVTMADIGIGKAVRYGGTVWDDYSTSKKESQQLNGRRDEIDTGKKEAGIGGITLIAYEKGSDKPAIGMDGKPLIATTNQNGEYVFESLYPGREYVIRIETTTVHGVDYKVTPVQPNPGKPLEEDEDNDGKGKTKEDGTYYIETGSFKAEYPRDENGCIVLDPEDPGKVLANSKIDIGLVSIKKDKGFIGDTVWVDSNHNGIYDEEEEPYRDGLTISLEPWYYNPNTKSWEKVEEEFAKAKEATSDQNGFYIFKELPSTITMYYDKNGNVVDKTDEDATPTTCIRGYRPYVKDMPSEYTHTGVEIGNDREKDNNLNDTGYLVKEGEYLILASEDHNTEKETTSRLVTVVENGKTIEKYYKTTQAEYRMDYDIGLIKLNSGGVSGHIFADVNGDGLQDPEIDKGIEGVKVYLEALEDGQVDPFTEPTYTENTNNFDFKTSLKVDENGYVDPLVVAKDKITVSKEPISMKEPMITEDGKYHVVSLSAIQADGTIKEQAAVTVTDKNGRYQFLDVPLYKVDENGRKHPIRYRIRIEKPYNAQMTMMNVHDDTQDSIDSDFGVYDRKNHAFESISESFVLGKRLYDDPSKADAWGNQYDYTQQAFRGHMDAGFLLSPIQVEIGDRVWNDLNKNGIQDQEEYGIEGLKVTLYRFNKDIETMVYVLNDEKQAIGVQTIKGKWEVCRNKKGVAYTTKTDAYGHYSFQVPAYEMDPNSEHYLEPYHYRAALHYDGNGELSPLHATLLGSENVDSTLLDSNGYGIASVIDLVVKSKDKAMIERLLAYKKEQLLAQKAKLEEVKNQLTKPVISEDKADVTPSESTEEVKAEDKVDTPSSSENTEGVKAEDKVDTPSSSENTEEVKVEDKVDTPSSSENTEEVKAEDKVDIMLSNESITEVRTEDERSENSLRIHYGMLSVGSRIRTIHDIEESQGESSKTSNGGEATEGKTEGVSNEGETTEEKTEGVSNEGEATEEKTEGVSNEGETTEEKTEGVSNEGEATEEKTEGVSNEGEATEEKTEGVSNEGETTEEKTEGVSTQEKDGGKKEVLGVEEFEDWEVPKFSGELPYNTPVGNLFGINPDKNLVISDEFKIANVFKEEKIDNPKELLLHILERIWKFEQGNELEEAKCEIVEGSTQYFAMKDAYSETKEIALKEVAKKVEEYADICRIYSDVSIDFGIYDPSLPNPNPNPNPEDPNGSDEEDENPNEESELPKEEDKTSDEEDKTSKEEDKTSNKEDEKSKDKNHSSDKEKKPSKDEHSTPDKGGRKPSKDKNSKDNKGKLSKENIILNRWKKPERYIPDFVRLHPNIVKTSDSFQISFMWLTGLLSGNIVLYLFFRRSKKTKSKKIKRK